MRWALRRRQGSEYVSILATRLHSRFDTQDPPFERSLITFCTSFSERTKRKDGAVDLSVPALGSRTVPANYHRDLLPPLLAPSASRPRQKRSRILAPLNPAAARLAGSAFACGGDTPSTISALGGTALPKASFLVSFFFNVLSTRGKLALAARSHRTVVAFPETRLASRSDRARVSVRQVLREA
ncbi:hypothetical protein KC327_g88 [Hortaea werneckii]|nr:hypothetical protein KC327_g88 [Hortaea werneckii]